MKNKQDSVRNMFSGISGKGKRRDSKRMFALAHAPKNTGSRTSPPGFDGIQSKLLRDLKNHIVQIECLVLGVILFSAILSIGNLLQSVIGKGIGFLFPFIFLAIIPLFVRVTNPSSMLRSMLTWGMSGAGIGGMVGGSITGTLTGGLGAPAGALIGGPVGFICGAIAAPFIDRTPSVLTQGEARDFLVRKQKHYPDLNLQTIVNATKYPPANENCHVAMFPSDGILKCAKKEVIRWLKSGCWKEMNVKHGMKLLAETESGLTDSGERPQP